MKHKKRKEEETEQINNVAEENTPVEASEQIAEEAVPNQSEETDNKEVLELKKQSDEYYNRLLRMQADFENYKREWQGKETTCTITPLKR